MKGQLLTRVLELLERYRVVNNAILRQDELKFYNQSLLWINYRRWHGNRGVSALGLH